MTLTLALAIVLPARGASLRVLDVRAHQQQATVQRSAGTVAFFARRPWLARTPPGRVALSRARVWLRVARRELAETRADRRARVVRTLQSADPAAAICQVFGPYCQQALAVARCESGLSVNATNGQYKGVLQLGEAERARYGHGSDAYSQARAAYAYFVASGRDWSPWECKPR